MRRIYIVSLLILLVFFIAPTIGQVNPPVTQNPPPQKEETETPKEEKTTANEEALDLKTTKERAIIGSDDFFYITKEGDKIYLQISTDEFAVVFAPYVGEDHLKLLLKESDFLIDAYIWKDVDFLKFNTVVIFKLAENCPLDGLVYLLNHFNQLKIVRFASPIFIMEGEEFILKGKFEMKVKHKALERIHDIRIENGVMTSKATTKDLTWGEYIIDLDGTKMNYLHLVNFFAQDRDVIYAVPLFQKIKAPVTVKQEIEFEGARIGVKIPYKVTIRRDEGIRIDPSSLINLRVRPTMLIKQNLKYDPKDIVKGTELVAEGYIQIFAPGDHTIKPIKLAYVNEDGQGKEVESNKLFIRIASLVPEGSTAGVKADVPMDEYQPNVDLENEQTMSQIFKILAMVLGVSTALLIFYVVAPVFAKASKDETTDPVMEAVKALEKLVNAENNDKDYFSNVDKALRELLTVKTGSDFSSGPVQSVVEKLEDKGLAEKVEAVLKVCDDALSKKDLDLKLKDELVKAAKELFDFLKA